jgi:3-methyladenine DNA glycosylase AlkD
MRPQPEFAMVVKALSWALREASKKHPEQVRRYLAEHKGDLAARVIREVNNKLTTGLKTPHISTLKRTPPPAV